MTELIKITEQNGKQAVSARELYSLLEYKDNNFTKFHRRFISENEYAVEGVDYQRLVLMDDMPNGGKRESVDYALTIDFAKKLCMMSKTEVGNKIRDYFIECENIAKSSFQLPQTFSQALMLAAKQAEQIEQQQKQLQEQKPLVDFANNISTSTDCILVRQLAKLASDEGIKIGEKRLYQWLRDNNYVSNHNEPYQHFIDSKLFELRENVISTPYGKKISHTTMVTGKGQIYFIEKLRELNSTKK